MLWIVACATVSSSGSDSDTAADNNAADALTFTTADADATLQGAAQGATVLGADLDGDGYGELLLGTAESASQPGSVSVAIGPPSGFVTATATWTGQSPGDGTGYALAVGDLDGNGDADLAIGAFLADLGAENGGGVYGLLDALDRRGLGDAQGRGGTLADASMIVENPSEGDLAGVGLAFGGWNGRSALAVGACQDDASAENAGAVYLLDMPLPVLSSMGDAAVRIAGEATGDATGASLAGGDVDGDGTDDLFVGAWLSDLGGQDAGAAYVVRGPIGADLSLGSADTRIVGEAAGDYAGAPVSIGGDLTGDGLRDLLVGAWMNDGSADNAGAVYVIAGNREGDIPLASANAVVRGDTQGDFLGVVDSGRGDVDGDGQDDLLVGGPGGAGRAHVYFGPVLLGLLQADRSFVGDADAVGLGSSVSLADLDADGLSDVLVGTAVGRAFVFYGVGL